MILSHKIRIKKPTKTQETAFKKACGTARFTYNWGLNRWQEEYKLGNKPNGQKICKIWNQEKPEWVYESPKDANQYPFINLQNAHNRFFKGQAKYPTYKKKGKKDSFYVSNDKFRIKDKQARLPLIGWVKLTEKLRFIGKIMSGTVSRQGNNWYLSINVEVGDYKKDRIQNNTIGIDAGLKEAITDQNGNQIKAPQPFNKCKNKVARANRRLSKKVKGSSNWHKQLRVVRKLNDRMSNIRKDFWHKITSRLCSENQAIFIEDLDVQGMQRSKKRNFILADVSLREFFRQLDYKKLIYDNIIIKLDRYFPSSQLCSCCGNRQPMPENIRTYDCKKCGISLDRDINAAINIHTAGLAGFEARGHFASGVGLIIDDKHNA